MRPPPLLIAGALLFWGACTGKLVLAAAMAAALEGMQRSAHRWELSRRDFETIADLCTLALAGVLSYLFAQTRHFPGSLAAVLVWLPVFYCALVLAQRASSAGRLPLSALLWSLRSRRAASAAAQTGMSLDFLYASLCVVAAGAANVRSPWFFAGACALCLYALWPARRTGDVRARWAAAAGCAVALGFGIQYGISALQSRVEEAVLEWLTARWEAQADPYRAHTAIGDLGRVKLSDRIVLRVSRRSSASPDAPLPLLRTASYQRYAAGGWLARNHPFTALASRERTWDIAPGSGGSLEVSTWLAEGRALLALPAGTYRLDGLQVERAERNPLGAVRVALGPDPLVYRASFDARAQTEAGPGEEDLHVPASLEPLLARIAAEVGLQTDAQRFVDRLAGFFATRFAYSLSLTSADGEARDLARFLETDRRGHCEYFATAAVLMLRQAGIPARYAVGYSVNEYSPLEGQYLARRRDAHAWALAWVDGRWVDVDTTPGNWFAEESRDASPMQPLYDLLSWLNYRLAQWRSRDSGDQATAPMLALAGLLAGVLGWRLYRQRARVATKPGSTPQATTAAASPLQSALDALARDGHVRPPGMPLLRWAKELPLADAQAHSLLLDAVRLQYALRFDVGSSGAATVSALREAAARLTERLRGGG
jgi:transglutaminase-like putative cysteine protease/protein-S-isoprenylcysteine O-methyltransferase Ste14